MIQFPEAQLAANFDIDPTSILFEQFTECVCDWSMLSNGWSIQKFDLLRSR